MEWIQLPRFLRRSTLNERLTKIGVTVLESEPDVEFRQTHDRLDLTAFGDSKHQAEDTIVGSAKVWEIKYIYDISYGIIKHGVVEINARGYRFL